MKGGNKRKIACKFNVSGIISLVLLIIYCFFFIYLFVFGVINSFKTHLDFINNQMGLPQKWVTSSWETMFKYFKYPIGGKTKFYVEGLFFNGLFYSIGCSFVNVLVCTIAAYAASQYKFKFSKIIYGAAVFTMIFPVTGSAASEMQMIRTLGLYNHFWGMFVCKATFIGVYFMVIYAAFASIPKDYKESASIDGASEFRIMMQIMIPMISSVLGTVFLIYFIQYWNDFQTPLLYMPAYPTVSIGLYYFVFATDVELGINIMPVKLAACIFVFMPMFMVFMAFQKRLLGNISMSEGVKG